MDGYGSEPYTVSMLDIYEIRFINDVVIASLFSNNESQECGKTQGGIG
jgi:hypothetical protein